MKSLLLAGAMAAALTGLGRAETPPPRVVLAVDGVTETRNLPILVAERLGYFRDEGLTVTLVDAPADPSPAALMKDGRADGAVAFYHHTFMSQTDDQMTTQAVVLLGATPGLKLMGATRLKSTLKGPADLRGRTIYGGGANSGKTTALNWLMIHAGLTLGDFRRLPNGTAEAMGKGLADGQADAIMSHEPDADGYEAAGTAFTMADLETVEGTRAALGSIYPSTTLYMPAAYVASNPDAVQRLVNALLRANRFINGHTAGEIAAVLPAKAGGKDKAAFLKLIEEDKAMFATDGRFPEPAARQEWVVMTAQMPKYAKVKFEETFTNRFVDHAVVKP